MTTSREHAIAVHVAKFRAKVDAWTKARIDEYRASSKGDVVDHVDSSLSQTYSSEEEIRRTAERRFREGVRRIEKATKRPPSVNVRGCSRRKHKPSLFLRAFENMSIAESDRGESTGDDTTSLRDVSTVDDWSELYSKPESDLYVDVGCGNGRWALHFAFEQRQKTWHKARSNFLGLEIRGGLVRAATALASGLDLSSRCRFLHANVCAESITTSLESYPGRIVMFSIQLPDPRLSKNIHRKNAKLLTSKRVLDSALCDAMVSKLSVDGLVYVTSDYEEVIDEMNKILLAHPDLRLATDEEIRNLRVVSDPSSVRANDEGLGEDDVNEENPFGILTQREHFLSQQTGRRVRRIRRGLYVKCGRHERRCVSE